MSKDNLYKFTVVLLRPDYMCDDAPYGQDIYVAHVEADNSVLAYGVAKQQVFKADKQDGLEPNSKDDYALCVVFPGHIDPCLCGWQL